jgi:hypothetical protein
MLKHLLTLASLCICAPLLGQGAKPFDAAAAFGARPSVADLSLSPDGADLVYVVPTTGQGSAVYTRSLGSGAKEQLALAGNGKPDRLAAAIGYPMRDWYVGSTASPTMRHSLCPLPAWLQWTPTARICGY